MQTKSHLSRLAIIEAVVVVHFLAKVATAFSQGYTNLHNFGSTSDDGVRSSASLTRLGTTLYGTTAGDDYGAGGTVFSLNTDGSSYTNLHAFTGSGPWPRASLTAVGSTLYGTTYYGGDYDAGSVYALNTDGSGFTILHHFADSPSDGAHPKASLIVVGSRLYGTTLAGGNRGLGTVFTLKTDGSGYGILHHFGSVPSDGFSPASALTLVGSKLYGTTVNGGLSNSLGTVFALSTNGSGFNIVHRFAGFPGDGAVPFAALTLVGNRLFGTTAGSPSNSTVFAMNFDGSRYSVLHRFVEDSTDGVWPFAPLTFIDGTLYGTTAYGGSNTLDGTIFAINTDGSGYAILHNFSSAPGDGAAPLAAVTLTDSGLCGTTSSGGMYSNGTVFVLPLPAPPRIIAFNLKMKSNFKPGKLDNAAFDAVLDMPAEFAVTNLPVSVDIAGATVPFVLDEKGRAVSGSSTIRFSRSNTATDGLWRVTARLQGDWDAVWETVGLTNETVRALTIDIPLSLSFETDPPATASTHKALLYGATAGKSGTAR